MGMANIRSPLAVGASTFETFVCVPGTIFCQLNSSSSKRDLAMKQSADRIQIQKRILHLICFTG
jgi:hypothetical protein